MFFLLSERLNILRLRSYFSRVDAFFAHHLFLDQSLFLFTLTYSANSKHITRSLKIHRRVFYVIKSTQEYLNVESRH